MKILRSICKIPSTLIYLFILGTNRDFRSMDLIDDDNHAGIESKQ